MRGRGERRELGCWKDLRDSKGTWTRDLSKANNDMGLVKLDHTNVKRTDEAKGN